MNKAAERSAAIKENDLPGHKPEKETPLEELDVSEILEKNIETPEEIVLEYEPNLFGEEGFERDVGDYLNIGKEFLKILEEERAAEQARANKEDDLIGAKDAGKLSASKGTGRLIQQKVSNSAVVAAGGAKGLEIIEARKAEKKAAEEEAKKDAMEEILSDYRETIEQREEAQKQAEEYDRLRYFNIKEARDEKYALEQELAALKGKIKDEMGKAGTVAIVASGIYSRGGGKSLVYDPELEERKNALEQEIAALEKDITLASRIQNKNYLYSSAGNAEDFEQYSYEPEKEESSWTFGYKHPNQGRTTETIKGYMTEEERAVYNYYLNKYGEEKAEEFFDSIRDDLNYRQAEAMFSGNEGNVINEYILGAAAGFDQTKSGFQGALRMIIGDDSYQPTSAYQYASGMAREDLAKTGFKLPEELGGASLGQIGYDLVNTTANMMPSMMLGHLGGGFAGAVAMGASAGGNAYTEMINAGYNREQATNYAILVGGSEASLGYLLGGIEATGGKLGKAAMAKLLPKIDKALARVAVKLPSKMLLEFGEEYLQEVLDPVFRNIALMEENEINLLSEDAIYSGILGALSAGVLEGPGVVTGRNSGQNIETAVPFGGKAEPGTDAALVADKITEIESLPISEAAKAAKIAEVAAAVAETTGTPEVIAEAEKFKNIHEERALEEAQSTIGQVNPESNGFGEDIVNKILGIETASESFIEKEQQNKTDSIEKKFELDNDRKIIDFKDSKKIYDTLSEAEDRMISEGKYVEIADSDIDVLAEFFPDLRSMKKAERNEIIKTKNGELKEAIKNMLRHIFNGKNIEFEINGNIIEARLHKQGIDHVLKRITKRKAAVLNKTAEIFDKAEYVYSSFTDEHNDNADIEGWDYFYVPIELPDEITGVKISVLSNKRVNEHQIYDWDEKKTPLDGARRSLENTSEVQRGVSSSVFNVIIPPVSGKSNPPSIGNSVFGAGIFGNQNFGENVGADDGTRSLDNALTPSREREILPEYDPEEEIPIEELAVEELLGEMTDPVKMAAEEEPMFFGEEDFEREDDERKYLGFDNHFLELLDEETVKEEASDISTEEVLYKIFSAEEGGYLGKDNKVDDVIHGKSGAVNKISDKLEFFEIKDPSDSKKVMEYLEYIKKDSTIKYGNEDVRKWYVNTTSQIHKMIDESLSMEEKAHMAFNLRNEIRTGARNIMRDVELRKKLDAKHSNYTFDELVESKMCRKGLTKEEAIQDIYETAITTNKEVNAIWGIRYE